MVTQLLLEKYPSDVFFLSRKKLLLIHSKLFSFHQNPENVYNYSVMNCFNIDFTLCTSFKESLTFLSAKNI